MTIRGELDYVWGFGSCRWPSGPMDKNGRVEKSFRERIIDDPVSTASTKICRIAG